VVRITKKLSQKKETTILEKNNKAKEQKSSFIVEIILFSNIRARKIQISLLN